MLGDKLVYCHTPLLLKTVSTIYFFILLPTRSEVKGVLGFGSIPVATLPSCQDMQTIALQLHKCEHKWVVKIRKTFRSQYTPRLSC